VDSPFYNIAEVGIPGPTFIWHEINTAVILESKKLQIYTCRANAEEEEMAI
jgi:hypothetical protein